MSYLRRAHDLLPDGDAARVVLVPDLAEALMESGRFDEARKLAASVDVALDDDERRCAAARTDLVRLLIDLNDGDEAGWLQRARAEVDRLIPVFESAGNDSGLATAWRVVANADVMALQFDAGFEAADQIVRHAEAAQDARQQRRGAVVFAISTVQGSTPVDEGIDRCEELITSLDGDRRTQALVRLGLAQLRAMRGEFTEARDLCEEARQMLDELGWKVLAASTSTDAAPVEILAGDLDRAEATLRADDAALEVLGETYLRSTVGGLLAHVLVERGQLDEAERVAGRVRALAGTDDVDAQVLWRSALGRCLAGRGQGAEGLALLDEALALLEGTAAPMMRAQTLAARSLVATACGRHDQADDDRREAMRLYEAKGNIVGAERLSLLPG